MRESIITQLPKDHEARIQFLKLKYGISELEDSAEAIATQPYFITDATYVDLSYSKELVYNFGAARAEKQLKSKLLMVTKNQEQQQAICDIPELPDGVCFAIKPSPEERATLLTGSLAFIALMYKVEAESFYLDLMRLSVPLVLPKVDAHQAAVGHSVYSLERITEDDVSIAISKIENSESLRQSLKKSEQEHVASLAAR